MLSLLMLEIIKYQLQMYNTIRYNIPVGGINLS